MISKLEGRDTHKVISFNLFFCSVVQVEMELVGLQNLFRRDFALLVKESLCSLNLVPDECMPEVLHQLCRTNQK